MVGSIVHEIKEGQTLERGQVMGHFRFGGSTVLLLFESGAGTRHPFFSAVRASLCCCCCCFGALCAKVAKWVTCCCSGRIQFDSDLLQSKWLRQDTRSSSHENTDSSKEVETLVRVNTHIGVASSHPVIALITSVASSHINTGGGEQGSGSGCRLRGRG